MEIHNPDARTDLLLLLLLLLPIPTIPALPSSSQTSSRRSHSKVEEKKEEKSSLHIMDKTGRMIPSSSSQSLERKDIIKFAKFKEVGQDFIVMRSFLVACNDWDVQCAGPAMSSYVMHLIQIIEINLKGFDGIQGPFYVGTGCFFNRKALYGYSLPAESKCSRLSLCRPRRKKMNDECDYASHLLEENNLNLYDMKPSSLERENPAFFLGIKKYFGKSLTLIASIIVKDNHFSRSAIPEELLKEAFHV